MSLLTTLQVREVGFEWDSTKRVYRASEIYVWDKPDRREIEFSNGTLKQVTQGVWLFFSVANDYFQRLSPSGSAGNDYIDLLNALDDEPTTVTMYPIHDVDPAVTIDVQPISDRRDLLQSGRPRKGLFKPKVQIEVRAKSRLSTLPTWLRTTRER